MKVIDVFCFNGEPVLELRLQYLSDVVDEFVCVESRYTFSGSRKPSFYSDSFEHPKLTVLKLEDAPETADTTWASRQGGASTSYMTDLNNWYREAVQRDRPMEHVKHKYRGQDYVVCCSDVDEIPRLEVLEAIKVQGFGQLYEPAHLRMDMLMYNLKWRTNEEWMRPFIINSVGFGASKSIDAMRRGHPTRVISDAGWHLSYFLSATDLCRKLQSFAHQEYNTPEYTDLAHIRQCLLRGEDVLKRGRLQPFGGDVPGIFMEFHDKVLFMQKYA